MKKVSVIGISGSGKSFFSRKLSEKLNIPLYHYDSICWKENWTLENEEIVAQKISDIIHQDSWILEGYINPLAKERLEKSDIIIYLDIPGWKAVLGGIQRYIKHKEDKREELADGCTDTLDLEFLTTILLRKERPEIEKEIQGFENNVIRLTSRSQMENYLATVS